MKRIILLVCLGLLLIAPSIRNRGAIQQRSTQETIIEPFTPMANPASVYCVDQGYGLVIREDAEGNQYGVCISGNMECDEWDFYNGLCFLEPKCPAILRVR